MTNNYQFAGICVEITHMHSYFALIAGEYVGGETPEISITVTQADIDQERQKEDITTESDAYLESLVIYRKLCEKLVERNILLVHCAAIAVKGKAYLFTAPSGTGKTTHVRLWKKKFRTDATIINGDKPLISITPEEIRVWGTPWAGKERWNFNTSAPVAGICQIGRAQDNTITRVPAAEAVSRLYAQTFHPVDTAAMQKTVQLITEVTARVPFWQLKCNMSSDAAEVSYAAMKGE